MPFPQSLSSSPLGRLADGRDVTVFTLKNRRGFEAAISTHGGTLLTLRVPEPSGGQADVVLGTAGVIRPPKWPYFGTIIGRYAKPMILLGMAFVFFCGLFVAFVNLAAAFGLGVWALSAIGGFDAPRWELLFTPGNRRFVLMLVAGALVAVEPFWVAAHVVFVRKAGAQERGDDLRAWFEELRRTA